MEIRSYNRSVWDKLVAQQNRWTVPVGSDVIERAKQGDWSICLTPTKPVPRSWFPQLQDKPILCLASAGGQQAPVLAAAGAKVILLDNSPRQLDQDRLVAGRDGLPMAIIEGDMADLSAFDDESFDLIFNPCSNCFVPDVLTVWQECFRVLRNGGALLSGFTNPLRYIFDDERTENGCLEVRHSIPYSDLFSLDETDRQRMIIDKDQPLEFGHSLEDQIGGQLDAGLVITGFYEDKYDGEMNDPISRFIATFVATRAVKP